MKPISLRTRTNKWIANEWNQMAATRKFQIESGLDNSALKVLTPAILQLISKSNFTLDVGCGTGWLTQVLARKSKKVSAIDLSSESIRLAKESNSSNRIEYTCTNIEKFAYSKQTSFDLVVANMTLSTVRNLNSVLSSVHRVLKNEGKFVFTIPHPCFWPTYWGYSQAPWFNYKKEIAIQGPFRIEAQKSSVQTTHVHRPLEQYFTTLTSNYLTIENFIELSGHGFQPPRFIAIRAHKTSA